MPVIIQLVTDSESVILSNRGLDWGGQKVQPSISQGLRSAKGPGGLGRHLLTSDP